MGTAEFLSSLRERDVRLRVEDGRLKCDAPPGALDDELRAQLTARKQELLTLIAEAETTVGAPRSLVPLKPTGDQAPLFARPGHNGDVFCYRALATCLDSARPLYGVEPKGLDGSPTADTVKAMAEYEVAQIRSLQPEGPYYIAGFCAGGTVAFESAQQLVRAGEEVARLVLFGAPFPDVYRIGALATRLRVFSHLVKRHAPALTAGTAADRVEYLRSRASALAPAVAARHAPSLANRRRIEEATMAAVKLYEPTLYPGRIDVFLPSEGWRHSGDQPDKWRSIAGQTVEHVGPDGADGDNMLHEPHVRALATHLNQSLRDEEAGHATD